MGTLNELTKMVECSFHVFFRGFDVSLPLFFFSLSDCALAIFLALLLSKSQKKGVRRK